MPNADNEEPKDTETVPKDEIGPLPVWMRSVPEIPTSEEVEDTKGWIAALYPDDVFQNIIGKSRFSEKDLAGTKDFLLKAAYWYLDHRDLRHPAASFSADRTQLDAVAAAASELAASLQNLNEVAVEALWHPFHHSGDFDNPWIAQSHKTDFGLTIKKYVQPDGSTAVHYLKPPDIEEALDVLHRLAAAAARSFPIQKGGQPQDVHRQNWVVSAMIFWRQHSKVAFDHRSIAFDFCHLGFRQLERNVSPEQIKSAMRAAVKLIPPDKTKVS